MKDQDHQTTNQGNEQNHPQSFQPFQMQEQLKKEQEESKSGYRNVVDYGVWLSPDPNKQSGQNDHGLHNEQKDQIQTAEKEPIPKALDEILLRLETELGYKKSFDVAVREMTIGKTRIAMLCMSGLVKDTIMLEVLKRLTYLEAREVGYDALESFFTYYIPSAQVRKEEDWNLTLAAAMGGECVLYVDGEATALAI